MLTFSQLKGKVIAISDGDTFTLLTANKEQIKIRMYGIDAPEKAQDYGQKAKEYLSDLIYFGTVKVITKGIDQYGRTLGIIYRFNSNMNERMIQEGYAWHYIHYDSNATWTNDENNLGVCKSSNTQV